MLRFQHHATPQHSTDNGKADT